MEFLGGPSACRSNSLQPKFQWSVNENHGVAELLPAGFEQQGSIEDSGRGVWRNVFELIEDLGADAGPDDAIELFAGGLLFRGIAEDDCREFGAVDFAGSIGNLRTKLLQELLADSRAEQLLVTDAVSVDYEQGNALEGAHNRRLTRTYTTCDADNRTFRGEKDVGRRGC